MQRRLSFNTKLQRTHSEMCLKKKEFLDVEKKVMGYKFDALYVDMVLKNSISTRLDDLDKLLVKVRKDYTTLVHSVSPVQQRRGSGDLTSGIDFSRGRKMRMYENLVETIFDRRELYKEVINCMGNLDMRYERYSNDMNCLSERCEGNVKGKLHKYCKCPNIVRSCSGEECEICYDESVILFDVRCGNKHMLCHDCIVRILGEGKNVCPFCREGMGISGSEVLEFERVSKENGGGGAVEESLEYVG